MHAITFGAPAIFTEDIDSKIANNIYNIVYRYDPVPRLLGTHELSSCFIERFVSNEIRQLFSTRLDYKHVGRYYHLSKMGLCRCQDPATMLSLFPNSDIQHLLLHHEHSMQESYQASLNSYFGSKSES